MVKETRYKIGNIRLTGASVCPPVVAIEDEYVYTIPMISSGDGIKLKNSAIFFLNHQVHQKSVFQVRH